MAQVYAMSNKPYLRDGLVKIGLTGDLKRRKDQLQSGHPYPWETIASIEVPEEYTRQVEQFLHDALRSLRQKGEWFRISRERVRILFEEVEKLINVGHAIDGLQQMLSVFNEIVQAISQHAPVTDAHEATPDMQQRAGRTRHDSSRRSEGLDFRPYVSEGTKIRYGKKGEHYCTRRGDYLFTDDGERHPSLGAAAKHIAKLRGLKYPGNGWTKFHIRQGNEWVTLKSLRDSS